MANALQLFSIVALGIIPVLSPASFATAGQIKSAESAVLKQSYSAETLCPTALRSRMGGGSVQVSIRDLVRSSTGPTTRLSGSGTQTRGSNSQNFRFSCVVNTTQGSVMSLSYTFTGPVPSSASSPRTSPFSSSGFAPPRVIQIH